MVHDARRTDDVGPDTRAEHDVKGADEHLVTVARADVTVTHARDGGDRPVDRGRIPAG